MRSPVVCVNREAEVRRDEGSVGFVERDVRLCLGRKRQRYRHEPRTVALPNPPAASLVSVQEDRGLSCPLALERQVGMEVATNQAKVHRARQTKALTHARALSSNQSGTPVGVCIARQPVRMA